MIWYSLAELLPQKSSLPPLRAKIVIPPRSSFLEICFPPEKRERGEDTMKTTF